jgi:pimeloyl-ACP methyl ester carboxylesterase
VPYVRQHHPGKGSPLSKLYIGNCFSLSRIVFRRIKMVLIALISLLLLLIGLLLLFQRTLIYHPRLYAEDFRDSLAPMSEITYRTACGTQSAFYRGPGDELPQALWVCFNGNASTALSWSSILALVPNQKIGFLLIDYPGYGACEGKPSRGAIQESAKASIKALADHLNTSTGKLEKNMNVLGLSIGTAAGLDFATDFPIRKIILIAPFTRLLELTRHIIGWPLNHLLLDRFDNLAALDSISTRSPRPEVFIFHGTADSIVPVQMGKALADAHPEMVQFHAVNGADHNDVLNYVAPQVIAIIMDSARQKVPNPDSPVNSDAR